MERIHSETRVVQTEARLKALFLQGLEGDGVAYHQFLKQLSVQLRGFLRKRLFGWPDDVEDLVQETLIAVHDKRHTWRLGEPLTPWVHAIARYKVIDLLRARAVREALNDPLDDEQEIFASAETAETEARRDLGRLLSELPDRQRLPIVHVKLEGLSVLEAARLTGMSESAVKIGVHRGLKALAAKIRGNG